VDQTPVSGSTDELTFVRIGLYPEDPHERETRERPRDESSPLACRDTEGSLSVSETRRELTGLMKFRGATDV
jgi:hypothetical protein